jgi:Tol biopolymer transport system component
VNGKIAFTRLQGGNYEICAANADGSGQANLTNSPGDDTGAAWSPDGTRLAFVSNRGQNTYKSGNIFVMNEDGSGVRQLTFYPDAADINILGPAWSPDGSRLLYIYIAWSPLGGGGIHTLLYTLDPNGGGSQPKLIGSALGVIFHAPAWSPDGTRIAFALSGVDTRYIPSRVRSFVHVMNADGSGETKVADAGGPNSGHTLINASPSWSPDATRLVFVSNQDGNAEIYVMNADGGGRARLTNNPADDGHPVWSPDGSKIAFTSNRGGALQVYVMNADGSGQSPVTDGASDSLDPTWQPLAPKSVTQPAPATVQFSDWGYSVPESGQNGSGNAFVTVTRLGDLSGEATVDYVTSDGTANAGPDYIAASGTLRFAAGEASKVITVSVADDSAPEGSETINLRLKNLQGARFGLSTSAVLTVVDNDVPSSLNPIDEPEVFVRQHYLDFLNREPEAEGLAYWKSGILQCGMDARCIHNRRIGVSAAFFIESEFQENGYYVYRVYKAALNRRPSFAEFTADRDRIVAGTNLDASKQAFADEFAQRNAFAAQYPTSMTPEQYVDALNANTGNSLTQVERNALVNGLRAGAETRATVLRKVAENQSFRQKEYNSAFVLMQYFGYLRRDPDEGGYQFWLNVLNNKEPNNYRGMVCSFITSREYQFRFIGFATRSNADCSSQQ